MFYRRDQDLANRYIISISLMTMDMLYGSHDDLGNRYICVVISEIYIMQRFTKSWWRP
jgi:hypothetical protein